MNDQTKGFIIIIIAFFALCMLAGYLVGKLLIWLLTMLGLSAAAAHLTVGVSGLTLMAWSLFSQQRAIDRAADEMTARAIFGADARRAFTEGK